MKDGEHDLDLVPALADRVYVLDRGHMIRRLLDAYAEHHSRPRAGGSTRTRAKAARAG